MKTALIACCICVCVKFNPGRNSAEIRSCLNKDTETVSHPDNDTLQVEKKFDLVDVSNITMNYPNPFIASTMISYKIVTPGNVTILLFDLLGQKVREYKEGFKDIGESSIRMDLYFLNSGIYFYEIKIDGKRLAINKFVLLK